ncbi:MaoC family dehydratase [Polycladidibacter hongkongensis]|uniref:MaoC family dehydratase n=1 Tax=Polycladidibacter hongkongensis TaxID=1647556 RepID=UPI00082D8331|nr:MaoC family dehydratase [Pseudovibrio hongkongensis]
MSTKNQTLQKSSAGNYFEDFEFGQYIEHATPRTLTEADLAIYTALYGGRFAPHSAHSFARSIGYVHQPLDDLLVFHCIFGKSVPDISLNAVANLGYANLRFHAPVYAGDSLTASSTIIGLKENSNGKTGIVYVTTRGQKENGELVLEFSRWVMVKKREAASATPAPVLPDMPSHVAPADLCKQIPPCPAQSWSPALSGSSFTAADYAIGEIIEHIDGTTIEEAEHQLATRLYQNTAAVHFNAQLAKSSKHGKRLIYGGHIISIARSLSFNGLQNAWHICAINSGRHVSPAFAGDTIFASSQVLDIQSLPDRTDLTALRLRTLATKDVPVDNLDFSESNAGYTPNVLLDLDYWVAMPA